MAVNVSISEVVRNIFRIAVLVKAMFRRRQNKSTTVKPNLHLAFSFTTVND